MKKKAYCYKTNLHFLFLTAICQKGGKFLEIRRFFSIFYAGINFHSFNKIKYISQVEIFVILGKKCKN